MVLRFTSFVCFLAIALFATGQLSAQLAVTEVMSDSDNSGDWWELTNMGPSAVDLEGYYWDDNGPDGNDGALFGAVSIASGQSIVIVDEEIVDLAGFVDSWGGGFTALSHEEFGGPDTFSGLSSGGDQLEVWDADPNAGGSFERVAFVEFPAATTGFTFEWDANGDPLGLSVDGENGAFASTQGDIGSPGSAVFSAVPEPGSLSVIAGFGVALLLRRRK